MDVNEQVWCVGCGGAMRPQIDRLDLGWAGDGPYEDFAGILADVYSCACGRVAIRPVRIELSRSRAVAAA
jgi:hypothetical protein